MDNSKRILDIGGMSLTDQAKAMKRTALEKDWEITFQQADGKVRFALTSDPKLAEVYLKKIGAKILKVENTKGDTYEN